MNPERSLAAVERRSLLRASIVGSAAIMMPLISRPQMANASASSDELTVSGTDVRIIAERLSGMLISVDDAEKIAQSAATILGPLGYLRLLKTAEVRATFDVSALFDDATRARP